MAKAFDNIPVTLNINIDVENIEAVLTAAEAAGYVVIRHDELAHTYGVLRELSEGRGLHKKAADMAINYMFEELGEPGAGE